MNGLTVALIGLPLLLGAVGVLVALVRFGVAVARDDMEYALAALIFMVGISIPLLMLSAAFSLAALALRSLAWAGP